MKKVSAVLLSLSLLLAVLAGCSGHPATMADLPVPPPQEEEPSQGERPSQQDPADGSEVRTGLSVSATLGSSGSADADKDGLIQTDVTIVAVTVDGAGVITDCVIDAVQAKVSFDSTGNLLTDLSSPILSKNELGTDYGMGKISSIGKEWNEQVAALADYVVGKTVSEVSGIAVDEATKPADVDLASSVTISIGGFLPAIVEAVENASYLGAKQGDALRIVTTGSFSAGDLPEGAAGMVQTDVNIAAVTMEGETITSCLIDAVQAKASFDAAGRLLTDTAAPVLSKNALGTDYGMGKISSIGKEWNEQAAAFAAYVTGKTLDQVASIAVDEATKPADVDLASSVTISIGGFQALLEKLR